LDRGAAAIGRSLTSDERAEDSPLRLGICPRPPDPEAGGTVRSYKRAISLRIVFTFLPVELVLISRSEGCPASLLREIYYDRDLLPWHRINA
jgi:hypothetical protein